MQKNEQTATVPTVDEAIRIGKLLATTPDNRLQMVLAVLELAGIDIASVEGSAQPQVMRGATVLDTSELAEALLEQFDNGTEEPIQVPSKDFTAWCRDNGIKSSEAKAALINRGYIRFTGASQKGTETVRIDGKPTRVVPIYREPYGI